MNPPPKELKRGKLTKKKLEQVMAKIDEEGYVVLERTVPTTLLKEIRDAMDSVHRQHFKAHPNAMKKPNSLGKVRGMDGCGIEACPTKPKKCAPCCRWYTVALSTPATNLWVSDKRSGITSPKGPGRFFGSTR